MRIPLPRRDKPATDGAAPATPPTALAAHDLFEAERLGYRPSAEERRAILEGR